MNITLCFWDIKRTFQCASIVKGSCSTQITKREIYNMHRIQIRKLIYSGSNYILNLSLYNVVSTLSIKNNYLLFHVCTIFRITVIITSITFKYLYFNLATRPTTGMSYTTSYFANLYVQHCINCDFSDYIRGSSIFLHYYHQYF